MKRIVALALAGMLLGCDNAPDASKGVASPSEAQALNDAAEMLDQSEPPPSVVGGEDGATANSTHP